MKKQVFISHSCNQDPATLAADDPRRVRLERARSVRAAIMEKLDDGFKVWLDSCRLQPGDPWRLEIFQALYRSSAGIILLDEDAFASPWVVHEASILNFRRWLNPSFVLVPVLLDQGSSGRFDEGHWRPMALRDLMALKESPDAIAEEVAKRLANLAELEEDEDLDRWVSTLAGTLRGVAMGYPERLTAACEGLGITPEDWAADNASAIGPFAHAMLTAAPTVVATVANTHLKAAVPTRETRDKVRRLLVPIWVDLTAAGCAAAALRQSTTERRVFLNTAKQDVAAEYVDRAVYCAEGILPIRSTDVFGENADELFEKLEELVIDACPPIQSDPSSTGFKAWLSAYPYRRPVLFIRALLSPPQLKNLLDRLTDRFPGLTLFVHGGDDERSADEVAALGVTVIEPPLDAATESSANFYRGELKLFVGA